MSDMTPEKSKEIHRSEYSPLEYSKDSIFGPLSEYVKNVITLKRLVEAEKVIDGLMGTLTRISRVSQYDHPKSQIIGSEEYEGAWLDCKDLADKGLAAAREYRGKNP